MNRLCREIARRDGGAREHGVEGNEKTQRQAGGVKFYEMLLKVLVTIRKKHSYKRDLQF
jgi:hypothetical protein